MSINLDARILELESKILILEQENEFLSAKAEENLLLNRAFEDFNTYEDVDSLFINTLESISVLLDVPFSGIFIFDNNQFECISCYALFDNTNSPQITLELSTKATSKISQESHFYSNNPHKDFEIHYSNSRFAPTECLILPLQSSSISNKYFVFINDQTGDILSNRISLFNKITQIISTKLDKIYYQRELKRLNDELEQKVKDRTKKLIEENKLIENLNYQYIDLYEEMAAAKERAEESDRLKTAFLQNMSHEIRTPMNAIVGFSGLLVEYFDDKEELSRFVEIINSRSNDLLDIINDVLDIAKIESSQLLLYFEAVEIGTVFNELALYFNDHPYRLAKQQVQFKLVAPKTKSDSILFTDKTKLKQILTNLISNALKFTYEGEIEVGVLPDKNGYLNFYVSDTGIGIPLDKQTLIFERFVQVRNNSFEDFKGTGLGLAIVKGLVELLGGKIELKSQPNIGSTFSFKLPISIDVDVKDCAV